MFCQRNGRPIGASADWREWKELAEAGVRNEKLHLARHTAAAVLALLGVLPRIAMDFMGWSDPGMMLRYQHVTEDMLRGVADGIGGLFWAPEGEAPLSEDAGAPELDRGRSPDDEADAEGAAEGPEN